MMYSSFLFLLCLIIILLPVQALAQDTTCPYPTEGWQERSAETLGIDMERLTEGESGVEDALPFLRSILVVRHGCIAYERYFADATAETRFNSYSVTKSVTASLIGMAIAEGRIGSVRDSIADYLVSPVPPADRRITIEHLLKMLSGIGWDEDSAADIGGMLDLNRDEVAYILALPLERRPGSFWNYSTADSHLLSAILTDATGETTLEYATPRLFAPMGIEDVQWTQDASGYNLGGTQLFWRARDMAKFGLLYLRQGVWDGETLLSSQWIDTITTPQLADPSIYELSYAAHWWSVHLGAYPAMFAAVGYGGQYVIVAPEQDMVIVTTANSYVQPPDRYISGSAARHQEEAILDYVETFILASIVG